jgi:hypothetical protein
MLAQRVMRSQTPTRRSDSSRRILIGPLAVYSVKSAIRSNQFIFA